MNIWRIEKHKKIADENTERKMEERKNEVALKIRNKTKKNSFEWYGKEKEEIRKQKRIGKYWKKNGEKNK